MTDQNPRHRQALLQPHRGGLILTLGVLSFVLAGVLTAIPAWVMGSGDLKKMDASLMDPEGCSLTMAGQILGKVCTILTIVILAIALLVIAFYAASDASERHSEVRAQRLLAVKADIAQSSMNVRF